jgi:hypothetical protein
MARELRLRVVLGKGYVHPRNAVKDEFSSNDLQAIRDLRE